MRAGEPKHPSPIFVFHEDEQPRGAIVVDERRRVPLGVPLLERDERTRLVDVLRAVRMSQASSPIWTNPDSSSLFCASG